MAFQTAGAHGAPPQLRRGTPGGASPGAGTRMGGCILCGFPQHLVSACSVIPEDAKKTAALADANHTAVHGGPHAPASGQAPQYNRGDPQPNGIPARPAAVLDI